MWWELVEFVLHCFNVLWWPGIIIFQFRPLLHQSHHKLHQTVARVSTGMNKQIPAAVLILIREAVIITSTDLQHPRRHFMAQPLNQHLLSPPHRLLLCNLLHNGRLTIKFTHTRYMGIWFMRGVKGKACLIGLLDLAARTLIWVVLHQVLLIWISLFSVTLYPRILVVVLVVMTEQSLTFTLTLPVVEMIEPKPAHILIIKQMKLSQRGLQNHIARNMDLLMRMIIKKMQEAIVQPKVKELTIFIPWFPTRYYMLLHVCTLLNVSSARLLLKLFIAYIL